MKWLIYRIDSFLGTVIAIIFGAIFSQFMTFVQQYTQRLGGHLAEAQFNIREMIRGPVYRSLDQEAQLSLITPLETRLNDLVEAQSALSTAGMFRLPWDFIRVVDLDIFSATLDIFQPSIPLDIVSVTYTVFGLFLGWLIYDLIKMPFRRRKSSQL